jgi:hypothetical protein
MYKKAKSLILLAIIVAASAVSTISLPQNASAATANLYLSEKMKTIDRQIALRNSLALCVNYEVTTILGSTRSMKDGDGRGDEVSRSDLASGNWFYQGDDEPKARAGAIVDPDNGTVECRNLFKGRNVAKDLGFGSNIELACAIGLKRTDGSNCLTGGGDRFTAADTSAGKVYNALDQKLGIGNYNNAQLYVLAAVTYLTSCGGKAVVNVEDANPDQIANTDKYDEITVVTGTGGTKKVLFTKKNNDKVGFRNLNNDDFDYIAENCDWMRDRMNQYAGAYADWVKQPGNQAPDGDNAGSGIETPEDEEEAEESTCSVAVVGWIICPIVNNLLAPITDAAYAFVSALLTVQPLATDTTGGDNQIYTAWTVMRDFANVAFVIVFLLIVFSQLTNIGINNYGIKKMLPRLILAAVLVNVSYWICAIAVDLSNIAGASMKGLFADTAGNITIPDGGTGSTAEGAAGWVSLAATGLVATGAALYIGLSALLPALIIVLFTILITAITLLIRQVLIVLLIVVSPLAFVAYLLPNTESLFTKWRKLFGTLLLVFPIVGAIFGASELASKVITAAAPETEYTFAFQVMGAATAVIPLVLVPAMVKGTRALGGVIGGRFGNFLNNPDKGPVDRLRKGAEGYRKNRETLRDARALNEGSYRFGQSFKQRGARRQAVLRQRERNAQTAQASYVASTALSDETSRTQRALGLIPGVNSKTRGEQLLNQMAQGGGDAGRNAALAQAINVQQSLEAEEVKAATATIQTLNLSANELRSLSQGGSVQKGSINLDGANSDAVRAAAMQRVVDTHDVKGVNQLLDAVNNDKMDEKTRKSFADALQNSKEKPTYIGQGDIANIRQHGNVKRNDDGTVARDASGNAIKIQSQNSTELTLKAIQNNAYSVDKIATGDKDELEHVYNVAKNNLAASDTGRSNLKANATVAATDPRYSGKVGKNAEVVNNMKNDL